MSYLSFSISVSGMQILTEYSVGDDVRSVRVKKMYNLVVHGIVFPCNVFLLQIFDYLFFS